MEHVDFSRPCKIYFCGIGGISMSGIAEILKDAGFDVSGSDRSESEVTDNLVKHGIRVFIGQRAENIPDDIDVAVLTAAIHEDNPEYVELRKRNIPMLSRAQLLGQMMKSYKVPIAISGTHGKTTTTSLISQILLESGKEPTISVGGMMPSIGGNVRVGAKDYFVLEACEYTNSFLEFFPRIGVILNVEEDHMDFFKDIDDIRNSFAKFAGLLPADGALVINSAIPEYRKLTADLGCKVITYGMEEKCADGSAPDYYPGDISYDDMGCASFKVYRRGDLKGSVVLRIPGEHNIGNALAAIAVADECGIDNDTALSALSKFTGTDRRFQYRGTTGGVRIVDDYAHHPTEIRASLSAALKLKYNKLWVVFQPHTYSRTVAFLKDFAEALSMADAVVLADIYAAREVNTWGISSDDIRKEIEKLGKESYYFPSFEEIEIFLLKNCIKDDLLITMGAGDVYKIGEDLLGRE
ncbi:MAG: UDP-N-acetylmuramate--L-alanine ligase [Lachnospiraceae bacterium]|nr:UDP-N-acetylmuramate--L-alanine ligase [Lachnospiraceae bacterium]